MRTLRHLYHAGLIVLIVSCSAHAQQPNYVVSQKLRLTSPSNGVSGWLEGWIDSRLTPDLQEEMWGVGDWSFVLSESDRRYALFKAEPPRNAQLRISSS